MNCLLGVESSPLANTETLALMQMSLLYKTNSISLHQGIFNYISETKHPTGPFIGLLEIHVRDFDLIQPAGDCGAGHSRCSLPIGHCPLWQTLPAVPCNRSVRRKYHQGRRRKVPNRFYPLTEPCCNLPGQFPPSCPSESQTPSLLSGQLLRASADTSLTSLLSLTLQQRLCPG